MLMHRLPDHVINEAIRLYVTPQPDGTWLGAQSIRRLTGMHTNSLYYHLAKRGIAARSARESHANGKRCKPIKNLPPPCAIPPACRCGCGSPTTWLRSKNRWRAFLVGHWHGAQHPYKQRNWLIEQYLNQSRTIEQIASEVGRTPSVIARLMQVHRIPARNRSEARIGRQAGARNPAWRGGVTPERQRIYKSQAWKALILAVWRRDNFQCRRCSTPKRGTRSLHAHHIARWSDCPELRTELNNLVTLCNPCHKWVHSRANTTRVFLAREVVQSSSASPPVS
jgi:hypothetical protein